MSIPIRIQQEAIMGLPPCQR